LHLVPFVFFTPCGRLNWLLCSSKTHTHPFNGPFSGTTRVSRYQKGKNSLDFSVARDSAWQWHQLGHMQICISLQAGNHTSTPPLLFTGRMPFLPPEQQCQSVPVKTSTFFDTVRISRGSGSIKWSSVRLLLCPSVRPSVCPVVRQQEQRAAGLLLSASRAGDISR